MRARVLPLPLALLCALAPWQARAQTSSATVVRQCNPANAPTMQVGAQYPLTMDPSGNLCVYPARPTVPAPQFVAPGPPVLSRWRASCQCFLPPP